jgi:hypothetical protein
VEQVEFLAGVFGPLTPLVVATLLATVNSTLIDMLKAPLVQRFPNLDLWWFVYVNVVTGFLIGWFAVVNLFVGVVPNETLGRILSSLLIGGGATLIYKVFKKAPEVASV